MDTKKSSKQKTPAERSPKAHMPLPPRRLGPAGNTKAPGDHGTGEFTGELLRLAETAPTKKLADELRRIAEQGEDE